MDDLCAGVHAGIGPTGTVNGNRLVRDRRNRSRKTGLYAAAVALLLPTDEIGTVVFEPQGYTRHERPGESVG